MISGNWCLYCMFQLSNIGVLAIGAGVATLGIYLCVIGRSFDWDDGGFIGLGSIIFILGRIGCKLKYSPLLLTTYIIGTFFSLLALIGITTGVMIYEEFSINIGEKTANNIKIVLIGSCCIMFVSFILAICYKRSLIHERETMNLVYQELESESDKGKKKQRYKEIKSKKEFTEMKSAH